MSKQEFANIKTEGGLLPAELLRRIAAGDTKKVPFLTSNDYHLGGERLNEAITRVWNLARGHWERFKQKWEKIADNEVGTSITRTEWLLPLFKILDYGQLQRAKSYENDGKIYPVSHEAKERVLIHLVGFRQDLDRRDTESKGGARVSPHSMVQEYLNRNDKFTWAFLSNGLKFRILRDNVSLIRSAYVEFDLEAIMEHESFAEFFVFYLLVHQSRVEEREDSEEGSERVRELGNEEEDDESLTPLLPLSLTPILERWYKTSIDDGVRVLEELRRGVAEAIKTLGSGFLAQPKNRELREMLRNNQFSRMEFYHELLRTVYRLLFLYVAEDRELLFAANATDDNKKIYKKYYSVTRLRELARKRRGSRHIDLWKGLRLLFDWLDKGRPELNLPGIGSFIFRSDFIPTLTRFELNNDALLAALRHLTFTSKNNVLQPIDYRNMGTEELGSVNEALLEMHPDVDAEGHSFDLRVAAGNERKTTGSYYTPPSLVESLLDTALDPVIDDAIKNKKTTQERVDALLALTVCDPACGSGHFLIGAAHRMGKRLAQIRSGEDEPTPTALQHAVRDVIAHCIYGVDINPMSVELCKISLWIESMEPGKALVFLDHRIKCGNSLLGATPELLAKGIPEAAFTAIEGDDKPYCTKWKRINKEELTGQSRFDFDAETPFEMVCSLDKKSRAVSALPDETTKDYENKEQAYHSYRNSLEFQVEKLKADLWSGAFVWKKTDTFDFPITQKLLKRAEKEHHFLQPWMETELQRLVGQYQFFHWHLEFPEVSGFDAVLGNPPWERVKLQEKEWFDQRDPAIAAAPNAAARKKMIDELKRNDPSLSEAFLDAVRKAEGASLFVRQSGRYPLCGRGDVNTYTIFAELNRQLLSSMGRVGCIVPSGIATDDTTKFFFQDLMANQTLVSLYDFENRKGIFPVVHRSYKFSLLTMRGNLADAAGSVADFAFFLLDTKDLDEEGKRFRLSPAEIAMINPNTRTCPIFRSVKDAELTKAIYRRVPVLIREARDGQEEANPWGIKFSTMFHMSNDSHLFRTKEELEKAGYKLNGNVFQSPPRQQGNEDLLPLYEAKMIHHYNHRFGDYADLPHGSKSTQLPTVSEERLNDPDYAPLPRYWVSERDVRQRIPQGTKYLMGWRDITNTTNERTVIASLLPSVGVGNNLPLFFSDPQIYERICLHADMTSLVHDFSARQKVSGTHINFFILNQIPHLSSLSYKKVCPFSWKESKQNSFFEFIFPRILEVSYTTNTLQGFAESCGDTGDPFQWNESRRFLLRCELDALFFGLYLGFGDWSTATEHTETPQQFAELTKHFPTQRDAVEYIMETFPIVKRKDIAKHGNYRTKETILSIYDKMVAAIRTGSDYQTRLDPPPAHDSMRHGYVEDRHTPDSLRTLAALEKIKRLPRADKLLCSLFLNIINRNPSCPSSDSSLAWVIGSDPVSCKPLLDTSKQLKFSKVLKGTNTNAASSKWMEMKELLEHAKGISIDRQTDNQHRMSISENYSKIQTELPQSDELASFVEEVLQTAKSIIQSERLNEATYSPELVTLAQTLIKAAEQQIAPLNIAGLAV